MKNTQKLGWLLAVIVLVWGAVTLDVFGQPLRIKVSTAEILHSGSPHCFPMFDPAISLGGVTVNIGTTTVKTEEEWTETTSKGVTFVEKLPGEYGVSIVLPEGLSGEISEVVLEGEGIHRWPPHVRKTDFGDYVINISAESAKQPLGSGQWDYWLAISICLGEKKEDGDAPQITLVTIPITLVIGEKTPYEVDFSDLNGDIVDLQVKKSIFADELNQWVELPGSQSLGPRGANGKKSGSMEVAALCNRIGRAKLTYTLVDEAGNISDPFEVEVNCIEAQTSSKPKQGTGAAAGWAARWLTDAFGVVNLHQVEANRMAGAFEDVDGFLEGDISPDGTTLTGTWYRAPTFNPPSDAGDFELSLSPDQSTFSGTWRNGSDGEWVSMTGTKDDVPLPPAPPTPGPGSSPMPSVVSINIPNQLIVDRPTAWQLSFFDEDGNITLVRFEHWINEAWEGGGEFDPNVFGQTQGTFDVFTTCRQLGSVRGRVALLDEQGNISDWREYAYECVADLPPLPLDQAPKIVSVDIPARLVIDVSTPWQLSFSDAEGNVVLVQFEQWVNGAWDVIGEFDPEVVGETQGTIRVRTTCRRLGTTQGRIILVDAVGNSSLPYEYSYQCISTQGSTPSPSDTVPQALDSNANGLLDDAEIRQAIQLWIFGSLVPGTDQRIDDAMIRTLIQMWILGQPVSQRSF